MYNHSTILIPSLGLRIIIIVLLSLIVPSSQAQEGSVDSSGLVKFEVLWKDGDKRGIESGIEKSTHKEKPISVPGNSPDAFGMPSRVLLGNDRIKEEPWIIYSISATRWSWNVRRPGTYAAKCLVGTVSSNVDVVIHFDGFEDLSSTNSPLQNLETYYSTAILDLAFDQLQWHRASDLNKPEHDLFIAKSPTSGTSWNLWNKISAGNGILSDEYFDDAFITFTMLNVGSWVDPTEGSDEGF